MEDTGTRTRTQLKMKVLRYYYVLRTLHPRVLLRVLSSARRATCWTGWRNMIREVSPVRAARVSMPPYWTRATEIGRSWEGRMKDRSGDEVSNSAGSVVAARQPRLGLSVWRLDQTKPGQAGFCPVLHIILIAPTILFYPIRHPLLLSWSWGTMNNLKPDRD
jgi:hypothetical protein